MTSLAAGKDRSNLYRRQGSPNLQHSMHRHECRAYRAWLLVMLKACDCIATSEVVLKVHRFLDYKYTTRDDRLSLARLISLVPQIKITYLSIVSQLTS